MERFFPAPFFGACEVMERDVWMVTVGDGDKLGDHAVMRSSLAWKAACKSFQKSSLICFEGRNSPIRRFLSTAHPPFESEHVLPRRAPLGSGRLSLRRHRQEKHGAFLQNQRLVKRPTGEGQK